MAMRKGQWVMADGKIGILIVPGFTVSEVHFVNAEGETTAIKRVATGKIRPASTEEIPVSRRPQG